MTVLPERTAANVPQPGEGGPWSSLQRLHRSEGGSLGEAVYESIWAALRHGTIPKGSRLVEGELALALDVSRTPVREALQRLAAEGLVRPTGNRGYEVADLMADAEVVYLVRARLEGLAAALAARNITLAQLEGLQAIQARLEAELAEADPDIEVVVDLNRQFHDEITRAGGSARLVRLVERLHPEYVSYQVIRSYDREGRQRSIAEHQALLAALWDRNSAEADLLVQRHLEHGKAVVLRDMEAAGTAR